MRKPDSGDFNKEVIHGLVALAASFMLLALAPQILLFRTPSDWVGKILYYPETPAVLLNNTLRKASSWFRERSTLITENQRLSQENWMLKVAISQEKVESYVERMNQITKYARITLRSPHNWWTEIRINQGEEKNLKPGFPVLQKGSLVGRITRVEAGYSWAELITSSSLLIPVVVDQTRDLGVVTGDGQGQIWLQYISEGRSIEKGMTVSTALVSESLPPGLPVGSVTGELRHSSGGFVAYRIEPGADFIRLYQVEVLTEGTKP